MVLQPFEGFKSLETHHCVSGSMQHIFEFNKCQVSEEMLLGLGSGVGFIYWPMKGTDPFMGGRVNIGRSKEEGMESIACQRLGVKVESIRTTSSRKAENTLLKLLEAGQPAMLQVDMGNLPYFDFGGEEYHFGYHVVVAAGYDPETRQLLIADRDLEMHPVSWVDLSRARGSTFKPFPPKNRLYQYDFSDFRAPTSADLLQSIRETADSMLNPPISNIGVKGIRKAAKQILKWHETMDAEALRRACFNCFIFIDAAGGTGGGIFRYMYGRYLKEVAKLTDKTELTVAGDEFKSIGDNWQNVAEIFKRASESSDPSTVLQEIATPMIKLAKQEQATWGILANITE